MSTVTKRGKASIEGIVGTIDVIVYPLKQSGKMTDNFDEEIIKDERGFDVSWLARNRHQTFDIGLKLLGDTAANAATGGAFQTPYATITLTGFDLTILNGAYQYLSGADIDLGNTKVADMNIKLRKYSDSTQNTLATTTPS